MLTPLMMLTVLAPWADPPELSKVAPQAAGVALVEVLEASEFDYRPGDGNKGVRFSVKKIKGTGDFLKELQVVTEYGGLRAPNSKPQPSLPLKPDSLVVGERYWIAFASQYDDRYNQRVIAFWPEDDAVAKTLEAAAQNDVLKWKPQYIPRLNVSYGHLIEDGTWKVRGEKDGKVVWEHTLTGKPLDSYNFGLFESTGGSFEVAMPACRQILFTESDTKLDEGNEFGLPPGPYYINHGFDPISGTRHGTWIRRAQAGSVEVLNRRYDLTTGKPAGEAEYDFPQTGGLAVGASAERWWRKRERDFDANGKVTSEVTYYYDERLEPDKRWVKVDSKAP
ncbi:MAG: hypothetical protein U0996_10355 [Planctomycetaceae bacterium]